ncbi:MAG TPA: hypothetical protein DDY59_00430 [Lachnospiraceae bacterium]|jgi:hypothetical protein|nr:hypothetical protein [Lachnospiraceae bacterium]HCM12754.1 hypothetical protein [Lachnospiraceae bacterium]HCR39384.1 hypothetical protein [Lachnospiraceae bacterium]
MNTGKTTRKKVGRAINLLSSPFSDAALKSSTDDYALIAEIVLLLAGKEYMSTQRAIDILHDTQTILPYITEL